MKPLFLAFILALSFSLSAQDIHLSQFYTADLNLNPALGGGHGGDYRIASNYRHQWPQLGKPISTFILAFDKKIPFYQDEFDAGILISEDQFGAYNTSTQKVLVSLAYRKNMGRDQLSFGTQVGMTMKRTDAENRSFPNQWSYGSGTFDTNLPNGENMDGLNQQFLDINTGISWSRKFIRSSGQIGLALFHVNRPTDSYGLNPTEKLDMRKVFHAETFHQLQKGRSLAPKLLYMWTSKAQDMLIGAEYGVPLQHKSIKNIFTGLLFRGGIGRNSDALIPIVALGTDKFRFGFSYDLTISELSDRGAKSTYEFSLIYTAPFFQPDKASIPCDRL